MPHTLRLDFSGKQSDRTILTIVRIPDLLEGFLRGATDSTPRRSDPPLGSGAYKVGRVVGRRCRSNIERVADYWGSDLPVNRGQNNFDLIRIEFYQDRQAASRPSRRATSFPRGVHLAHLGDRLRLPGVDRRQGVKREFPGREQAVDAGDGRQQAAGAVPRPAHAAGDRALLRLRMDQPQSLLRLLRALAFVLREVRSSRRRAALAGRAGAARAVPRPVAARSSSAKP